MVLGLLDQLQIFLLFSLIELLGLLTGLRYTSCMTWYIQDFWQSLTCCLLHKLKFYGISGRVFGLMSSFLSNRWLWMALDDKSSQEYPGYSMWNEKSSHLTFMDFDEILSRQCTHQEMKILKIWLSSHERFQNYSHLNYGPFSLDIESLQFMAFWKCSYLESFNSKHLKFWIVTHFLEVFTT